MPPQDIFDQIATEPKQQPSQATSTTLPNASPSPTTPPSTSPTGSREPSNDRWGGSTPGEAFGGAGELAKGGAALMTLPDMAARGIEGLASTLEDGSREFIAGIKSGDHEIASRGFGKMLASVGQIAAGSEVPDAVEGITEYAPREVIGTAKT